MKTKIKCFSGYDASRICDSRDSIDTIETRICQWQTEHPEALVIEHRSTATDSCILVTILYQEPWDAAEQEVSPDQERLPLSELLHDRAEGGLER